MRRATSYQNAPQRFARRPLAGRRGAVRQAGFTLVELLVVLIVIGILSLTLANFVVTWLQASSASQERTALLTDAENALDSVNADIRLSGSVDDTNRWADANAPGNSYGWQSGSQTLVLAKIAVDSSNNVIFSDQANYITQKDDEVYYLSGTTLYRRTLASDSSNDAAVTTCPPASATKTCPADTTVATGVSSWSVAYYDLNNNVVTPSDARSVQISITLKAQVNSQTVSTSYTSRMVFRNK